ncbi:hypothetical protein [Bradyrhizobium diazoefficiens]
MAEVVAALLRDKGFRGVQSFEEIKSRFIEIARLIMCSHELVYGEGARSWRITALELYLHMGSASNVWSDPFTHRKSAQLDSGTWYIHDNGSRAPFYSGIDITCGSEGQHGGMLIRELDGEHRWVFQRIVRGENIKLERTNNKWSPYERDIIEEIHRKPIGSGSLKLVQTSWQDRQLFIGQRIGLKKVGEDACSPEKVPYRTASLRIATSQTACLKTTMSKVPNMN